jgi:hypothetical protein
LHGAVPSTKASRAETNVTDAALNPAGTLPPDGRLMAAGAAVAGACDADRDTDGDDAAARAGDRAADGTCVVPHPAASATISSPPHAVANDFFIELAS